MKIRALIVSIFVFLFFSFTGCKASTYYSLDEQDYYDYLIEVKDAQFHMPQLTDLGEYDSITVTRRKPKNSFISTTDSIALFVTYEAEQFEKMLTVIRQKYSYLEQPIEALEDINAEINGFVINVVDKQVCYDVGNGRYEYPYAFLMIGYNELKTTIVYMFHYEHTIGTITDLDDFIQKGYFFIGTE